MGRTSGGTGAGGGRSRRGGGGSPNALDRSLLSAVSRHSAPHENRNAATLARSMPANSVWATDYSRASVAGATPANARRYADARHAGRVAALNARTPIGRG